MSDLQQEKLLFHAGPIVKKRPREATQELRLSPDGMRLAYSSEDAPLTRTTLVYERAGDSTTEARLVVTLSGHLGGWADDARLIVNRHDWRATAVAPAFREVAYEGTATVDLKGTTLTYRRDAGVRTYDPGFVRVPEGATHYYGRGSNAVYELPSGRPLWRLPAYESQGDLVGDDVVWVSQGEVSMMNWRTKPVSGW